ncbi:hypothetical protein GSI_03263 [Ganoderma sinense ZZ0214-1]|uniref:Uncharacterized protein n=1 Tax=Ganoderma sinense ZZ0214-1 TaxID=1077348 RepID=A0A2G8SL39_9APHY|nr:hypothetical protein GSI_03263 [Ganoderma sinense ZZ0214-1]
MAPNLTLNIPLEDVGIALAIVGGGALAVVLRNRGRARPADPEAIPLEGTAAAAPRTFLGVGRDAGTFFFLFHCAIACGRPHPPRSRCPPPRCPPPRCPLPALDNAIAGSAAVNTAAAPLPPVDGAMAADVAPDAIDRAGVDPLRPVDGVAAPLPSADATDGAPAIDRAPAHPLQPVDSGDATVDAAAATDPSVQAINRTIASADPVDNAMGGGTTVDSVAAPVDDAIDCAIPAPSVPSTTRRWTARLRPPRPRRRRGRRRGQRLPQRGGGRGGLGRRRENQRRGPLGVTRRVIRFCKIGRWSAGEFMEWEMFEVWL